MLDLKRHVRLRSFEKRAIAERRVRGTIVFVFDQRLVEPGRGRLGSEANGLLQRLDGLVAALQDAEGLAAVAPGRGVVRLEGERTVEAGDGLVWLMPCGVLHALCVPEPRIVGHRRHGLLEGRIALGLPSHLPESLRLHEPGLDQPRVRLDRTVQPFERLAEAPCRSRLGSVAQPSEGGSRPRLHAFLLEPPRVGLGFGYPLGERRAQGEQLAVRAEGFGLAAAQVLDRRLAGPAHGEEGVTAERPLVAGDGLVHPAELEERVRAIAESGDVPGIDRQAPVRGGHRLRESSGAELSGGLVVELFRRGAEPGLWAGRLDGGRGGGWRMSLRRGSGRCARCRCGNGTARRCRSGCDGRRRRGGCRRHRRHRRSDGCRWHRRHGKRRGDGCRGICRCWRRWWRRRRRLGRRGRHRSGGADVKLGSLVRRGSERLTAERALWRPVRDPLTAARARNQQFGGPPRGNAFAAS